MFTKSMRCGSLFRQARPSSQRELGPPRSTPQHTPRGLVRVSKSSVLARLAGSHRLWPVLTDRYIVVFFSVEAGGTGAKDRFAEAWQARLLIALVQGLQNVMFCFGIHA